VAGGQGDPGQAAPASPFLVFAVSVQRAAAELASAGHVPERTGPRQRVPLFDARVLNHVADRYLFPTGNSCFAQPGS
jgi:hypothetical protein